MVKWGGKKVYELCRLKLEIISGILLCCLQMMAVNIMVNGGKTMKLLQELCETPGISGREQAIIDIMTRELQHTADYVTVDQMGNVLGFKKGQKEEPKTVMIAGHMDEIGFVVSYIDKDGFLHFSRRGGHIPKVLLSQRVKIFGRQELVGVVEGAPAILAEPEDRKKVSELKDLYIDVGMKKEELETLVELGDIIVLDRKFIEQGDMYMAKAFDNRVGCYIVLETMRRLQKTEVDVYAVGTAQEEVGIRGAMSAAKEINPDFGIAIDVTAAFDTPDVKEHQRITQFGKGVAIKINDQASISNHGIVEFMKATARKYDIPYQLEILPFGGTDAAGMQRFGKGPVCTLSVPTRYVHSPNEMIHKNDLEAAINLLVKFIEECEQCQLAF
jgi:endoglucanase